MYFEELPGEPALADAGRADDADEARPPLAARGVEQVLEQAQLVVAADERRLERVAAVATAALGDDPERAPGRDRRRLALERLLAGLLEGDRARRPRAGSPRRRGPCPACATDWRRDAVLTRSPATMPWFVAPSVTAASPVRTPARAWMPGPEAADRVDELEARRGRRARRRPRARSGAPQTAITASPMNFSTVPP